MMVQLEQDYEFFYEFVATDADSARVIICKAYDSTAIYQKIEVEYDPETHYLLKVKYWFMDEAYASDPFIAPPKVNLTFLFNRYRVGEVGGSVFSELKYLFFDGPDDIRPADAYKDFTIYRNF
jgi:hypothetical protein